MKKTRTIGLPLGFEVREEAKRIRRSFALKESVLTELEKIADYKGTNVNALVNDVLLMYVKKEKQNGRV